MGATGTPPPAGHNTHYRTFGERLKNARVAAGLTQVDLARLVGISQQAIQKAETATNPGSCSRYVVELALHTGVSAEWLSTGQDHGAHCADTGAGRLNGLHTKLGALLAFGPFVQGEHGSEESTGPLKTVEEIRLGKLRKEIKERGHGGQAQIARAMGSSPTQIQQWLKGVRTISSASARRLERAIGKPTGWMDRDCISGNGHAIAPIDTIGDRIRQARERAQISRPELARRAGVTKSAVSQWEVGNSKGLKQEHMLRVAKILGVSVEWLVHGNKTRAPATRPRSGPDIEPGPAIARQVPLISWDDTTCQRETAAVQHKTISDTPASIISPTTVSNGAFALPIRDDTMWPRFAPGDTIIVDPARAPEYGAFVLARLEDGEEPTLKQLVIDGGTQYLRPLNARYPITTMSETAVIIGVVVAKIDLC